VVVVGVVIVVPVGGPSADDAHAEVVASGASKTATSARWRGRRVCISELTSWGDSMVPNELGLATLSNPDTAAGRWRLVVPSPSWPRWL
jgi:hypothetical protein